MKWLGQHIYDQVSRFRNEVFIENSDLTIYKPINDDPAIINLGSSAAERLEIKALVASGTQEVNAAHFTTYTASSTGNRGRFVFYVDETSVLQIMDAGLNLAANKGLQIGDTNIITDSYGTATLSNIDALDSTTIATFNSALTAGDITGVRITTDTGAGGVASVTSGSADLSILGTSGVGITNSGTTITATSVPGEIDHDSLLNFAADEHFTQANITTVGTIGTGVWQGTAIATAYIADDAVTEDKLADALLAEIDANTAKATNVSTDLSGTTHASQYTVNSSDGNNVTIAEASGTIAGVMTVAHHDKLDGIETGATADQTAAQLRTAIGTGNGNLVPAAGSSGEFLKHDGTFGTPAYISNTDTQLSNAEVRTAVEAATDSNVFTDADHTKLNGIETSATADQSSAEILTAIEDGVDSVHYVDGSIDTAHIADDQVTFAKALGVTPNVYGNTIKLIPSDFVANDDGGNTRFGIGYVGTAGATAYGMRVSHNDTELFAFVSIPQGMKATHVEVFGKRAKAVEVFEVQINASTLTSKGTGTCGIAGQALGDEEFALTSEVNSTATNLLVIEVTVTSNSADRVYGGIVRIAAI